MAKRRERKVSVALDVDAWEQLTAFKKESELSTLSAAIRKLVKDRNDNRDSK